MTVTSVANLALKVRDIQTAAEFFRRAGAEVTEADRWNGAMRCDVRLGALALTLFTRALYEDEVTGLPDDGFLHVACFTDDLDRELVGHDVVWGPRVVSGPTFGIRRIAFVNAPGNIRLEFMEQLEEPR
jgi:hypothetical protein